MKKRILLFVLLTISLSIFLAIGVGAKTIYNDIDGNEMFSYEQDENIVITSYKGSFPKTDAQGNALTWYITSTSTVDGNTVHTVASLKTLGEAGNINESGVYSFTSPVTNKNTVSVNYPDNKGITSIPAFGAYGTRSKNNILFAYCPNTLTVFPESLFQETPVLVAEIDDETPVTYVPHKLFHEARNVKTINIPASVVTICAQGSNQGSAFYNTLSLQTVTFAPNSSLTRIQAFAFESSNIEEIQFPDSLVAVNQNLFRGCKNLKVLRFGANFKYFENVDINGNPTTSHQSLTHTATSIQEIYLPASFYLTQPDVNYRVSYAFDGASNAKFFFTGTREQLDTSIANFKNEGWTTGATDHNYILNAYNDNKIVTWSEYSQNKDSYQGRYIITDYSQCDAFYKGVHIEDNNACVVNCDRCKTYGVAEKNPVHNISVAIVYQSYMEAGQKITGCTNEGCKNNTTESIAALVISKGYSQDTKSTAIVLGISFNHDAIEEYATHLGKSVEYGLIASSACENNKPINRDGSLVSSNAVIAKFTGTDYILSQLKITNIKDTSKLLHCCGYVMMGEEITYINGKSASSTAIKVSYDNYLGVTE